jgi:hypothetical protein
MSYDNSYSDFDLNSFASNGGVSSLDHLPRSNDQFVSRQQTKQDVKRDVLIRSVLEKDFDVGLFDYKGKPRLQYAQSYFENKNLSDIYTQGELIAFFKTWRDKDEYAVYCDKREDKKTLSIKPEVIAIYCAKRGNSKYKKRVKERFSFYSTLENKLLFDWKNRSKKFHKTSVLEVTLTFNTSLCDIKTAWKYRVNREYNSWITNLRNKFGRIHPIRSFEAFKNGYPHVHVVLVFQDKEFETFKKGNDWLIKNKEVFECGWKSFVKVKAIKDLNGGLSYLSKHIIKNEVSETPLKDEDIEIYWKYMLTLAMCWIFRKRSFSISKGFIDLMTNKHNSNSRRVFQADLLGNMCEIERKWEFLGVYSCSEIGVSGRSWFELLDINDFNVIYEKTPYREYNYLVLKAGC